VRWLYACVLSLLICVRLGASSAEAKRIAEQAEKAARAGRIVDAYLLYSKAVVLDPQNPAWWAKAEALRVRATLISQQKLAGLPIPGARPESGPPSGAQAETIPPFEPSPILEPLPPPRLRPSQGARDVDLQGDARELFTGLARLYQLEAVFDSDYPSSPPLRFRLEGASWLEAVRALEAATGSFAVPLSERRFLVARDTPQKRQEREPHVTLTVPAPDLITPQEIQEVRAAVQQVMQITRIAYDPARRLMVLRDRASLAEPAQQLVAQLLHRKPVVSVEIEFAEVNRQITTAYGASLATSYLLSAFGRPWNSPPLTLPGFTQFAVFGGGKSLLGFGIPDAQMLAETSRSRGQILFRAELRSLDGQPASLHVGQRFPIVTAREILPDPSAPQTYPPTFVFEDLGLVIKATPRVHGAEEITLSLETTFKALTGVIVQEIPVIAARSYQTEVRLREGEWAVVAGLMSSSEARTITGLAGLARIPVLKHLLAANQRDRSETDLLILLRPRLLSLPAGSRPAPAIATGSELRPRIPL